MNSKTLFIIALTFAVVGIGGGSYYYFAVFQPRAYAVSALSLYATVETAGLRPDTSSLKDAADYVGALTALRERIKMLESVQTELAGLAAPRRMAHFHAAFVEYADAALLQHARAASLAEFLGSGRELRDALKQIYASPEPDKIQTIGDIQRLWGERIPRAQTFAEVFFRQEIKEIASPSFAELRALWNEGSPVFDIVLARIRSANPRLSVAQMGTLMTPADTKLLEKRSKKLEEFLKKLDILLERHSAYDILALRYVQEVSQAEASDRILQFYQIMKELRETYAR